MFSIRCILLHSLPLISTVLSTPIPTASSVHEIDSILSSEKSRAAFRDIFKDVSEESLHVALRDHLYPNFKDGIYEFDQLATDSVNDENPPLATQLLMSAAVRLELAKRQTNETASPPPAATTTENDIQTSQSQPPLQTSTFEPPPAPTSTSPPPPPPSSTQEPTPEPTPEPSSPAISTPDPTIAVPITTTDSSGQTITSSVLQPGGIVTTTNAAGAPVVVTTPRPTTPTAVTRTDDNGSTFVTTITPSVARVTSVFTRTATDQAGSTVYTVETQIVEVVGATPEETAAVEGPGGGDGTTTAEPGLQSEGAGVVWRVDRAVLFGVGGAMGAVAVWV